MEIIFRNNESGYSKDIDGQVKLFLKLNFSDENLFKKC